MESTIDNSKRALVQQQNEILFPSMGQPKRAIKKLLCVAVTWSVTIFLPHLQILKRKLEFDSPQERTFWYLKLSSFYLQDIKIIFLQEGVSIFLSAEDQ